MKIQTKEKYLRSLRRQLTLRYSKQEACSILEDYHSFFDTAEADGKSQQQICAELGSPAAVVQALQQESIPRWKRANALPILLLTAAALIVWWLFARSRAGLALLPHLLICLPLVGLLLWAGLVKKHQSRVKPQPQRNSIALHLLCAVLGGFLGVGFPAVLLHWIAVPPFNLLPWQLGGFVLMLYALWGALAGGVLIFSLVASHRGASSWFAVTLHSLGVLGMLLYQTGVLRSLEIPHGFFFTMCSGGAVYLEGILLALLFWLYDKKQGGGTAWMHN